VRISRVEINKLPKIELQCHLAGAISLKTLRTLAKKAGVKLPRWDADLQKKLDSQVFNEVETFILPLLQTEEALALAAFDIIEQAIADQIRYIEVRFAPLLYTAKGLSLIQVIQAVIRGLKAGEKTYGVKSNAVLSGLFAEAITSILQVDELFADRALSHVAGFELSEEMLVDFPEKFASVLEKMTEYNLSLAFHARKDVTPKQILTAISFGVTRIDQGYILEEMAENWEMLAEKKVTFDISPTSDFQAQTMPYPFKQLLEAGVSVTINTDNRTIFATTLNDVYEKVAKRYHLNELDFRQLANYAFEAAFMTDEQRKDLEAEFGAVVKATLPELALEERIARLDATMAQKVLSAKKEVFNRASLFRKIHYIREEGKSMSVYLTKYLITSLIKFVIYGLAIGVIVINFALMILGNFTGILGKKTFRKVVANNPFKGLFHQETRLLSVIVLIVLGVILTLILIKVFKIAFKIKATDDYLVKYSFHKRTSFASDVRALLEDKEYYILKANKAKLLQERKSSSMPTEPVVVRRRPRR
jgi:adenosine deaminase